MDCNSNLMRSFTPKILSGPVGYCTPVLTVTETTSRLRDSRSSRRYLRSYVIGEIAPLSTRTSLQISCTTTNEKKKTFAMSTRAV